MLVIHNVKVNIKENDYAQIISQKINVPKRKIKNVQLLKRSIDARRSNVHYMCSFIFETENEERIQKKYKLQNYVPYHYEYLPTNHREVTVVGSGPAGLFCAYVLAHSGNKVTLIERGSPIEERVKDVDAFMNGEGLNEKSNISFGEGGAGTFSDGKLTTGIKNPRIRYVLDTFITHGAPEEIGYEALPHIGTDRLRDVMISMRKELIKCGVQIMFNTTFIDFNDDHEVILKKEDEIIHHKTDDLVLALGHSARDTIQTLASHMTLSKKDFAIGVRIEQKQSTINEIQYKEAAPLLKAAPYKLAVKAGDRGVYTFCMCPGGVVVNSSDHEGEIVVNGMSYYARDKENANSAILVQVTKDDLMGDALSGIDYQRAIEKKAYDLTHSMKAPVQKVYDYFEDIPTTSLGDIKPSIKPGYVLTDINPLFPDCINKALKEGLKLMNERMPGFIDEHTIITGVETRSSSPVRIEREKTLESVNYSWVYPCGEGAGYSGGIMSSAVDGIKVAEAILNK